MKATMMIASTALAAVLVGPASAQERAGAPTIARSSSRPPVVPTGVALMIGGGVTSFSERGAHDRFDRGGFWDLRAVWGIGSFIGTELAYVGSSRAAKARGVGRRPALMNDGAEATLRANLPIPLGQLRLEPYGFGGFGWSYYWVAQSDPSIVRMKDHANAFVIPFGGGLSVAYRYVVVEARFTYRSVFHDHILQAPGSAGLGLENWSLGMLFGYQI